MDWWPEWCCPFYCHWTKSTYEFSGMVWVLNARPLTYWNMAPSFKVLPCSLYINSLVCVMCCPICDVSYDIMWCSDYGWEFCFLYFFLDVWLLKGNYHENLTFWNNWHTWTYNEIKFMASQFWANFDWLSQKVNFNHFLQFDTKYTIWHTTGTSLVPRAAENNMGWIGVWSISMRFWSNTMPECFGTGFSNHQGTLRITLHRLPKYHLRSNCYGLSNTSSQFQTKNLHVNCPFALSGFAI